MQHLRLWSHIDTVKGLLQCISLNVSSIIYKSSHHAQIGRFLHRSACAGKCIYFNNIILDCQNVLTTICFLFLTFHRNM